MSGDAGEATTVSGVAALYQHVDWGLLMFFVGLFIIVAGAERAGLTKSLLQPFSRWDLHSVAAFVPLTALVSNLVSNVPAVMVLRTFVVGFQIPIRAGWRWRWRRRWQAI
jgi:Na+/H+ antiporter NhaD/arsenite permease-like protein